MMTQFRRTLIHNKYHSLDIFECPSDIIQLCAEIGSSYVTIENYTHFRKEESVQLAINAENVSIHPLALRYDIDFRLTRDEFIALLAIWNVKGCYAVFHEDSNIPFKITSLAETARYKALDNFTWTIELAAPDSASDGWSKITSPNASLIDRIETLLK